MMDYYLWFPSREEADEVLLPFIYPDDAGLLLPGSDIADISHVGVVMAPTDQQTWNAEHEAWEDERVDVGGWHVNWRSKPGHVLPEDLEMYNWPVPGPKSPAQVWA